MNTSKGIFMKVSRDDKKKLRILIAEKETTITQWVLKHLNQDYEELRKGEVKK